MIYLIITICAWICCALPVYAGIEIEKQLEQIPIEDRTALTEFFRSLLCPFAYTLFGDKPISTECFELNRENPDTLRRPSSKGYILWKKYAPLFLSKNYLFLFYEDPENNYCELTLVNKQAVRDIFEKHRTKFIDVLGTAMHAEKLLEWIVQKKSLWETPIRYRDDLIGILLGFGKRNAELFQKRNEILGRGPAIKRKRTKPSPGFASIDEELDALNTSLKVSNSTRNASLKFLGLPGFAKDDTHPETRALLCKYRAQRKHITQYYASSNILEITLQQLLAF